MKKAISTILALLLILTLAACGGGTTTPDNTGGGIDGLLDNELTKLLPAPLPLVISEVAEDGSEDALVLYGTLTYEDAKAYIAKLEEIGFTENAIYFMDDAKAGVSWTANKDGHYGISIGGGGAENTGSLSLTKW